MTQLDDIRTCLINSLRSPHYWGLGGVIAIATLALCSTSAIADPSTPSQQAVDAFALGYGLEYSHLRAFAFLDDVKQLRDVSDETAGDKMVASLTVQGEGIRKLEADAFGRASVILTRLDVSGKASRWADKSVAGLGRSVDPAPKGIISNELVQEHLANIIDETGRMQNEMLEMLAYAVPELRKKQGDAVLWAFNAGNYDAKVALWNGDIADIPMLRRDARHIIDKEPADTPADLDKALRDVLPPNDMPSLQKDSGNLSSLLPGGSVGPAGIALHNLPGVLTTRYAAVDLAKQFDDESKELKLGVD